MVSLSFVCITHSLISLFRRANTITGVVTECVADEHRPPEPVIRSDVRLDEAGVHRSPEPEVIVVQSLGHDNHEIGELRSYSVVVFGA